MVFWRKIFGRVVKIAFSAARESFLMKTISDKKNCNFILSGRWETLWYFWRQSYGSLVNFSLYMFRRTFWGEIGFLESIFFHHLLSSSKKFSEFWQEIFGRVVTTTFYMYIGTIFGKLFSFRKVQSFFSWFSESELQMFGLSKKIICYRCQDCILRC